MTSDTEDLARQIVHCPSCNSAFTIDQLDEYNAPNDLIEKTKSYTECPDCHVSHVTKTWLEEEEYTT